jgi:hypothetical protein
MCLHGYVLSLAGATRLLSLLNNPWTAYSTAVDLAVPSFISFGLLTSFSIDPPLINQRKDGISDISNGTGSRWKGYLRDSTWTRILRDEGQEVTEPEWVEDVKWWHRDPATVFWEKVPCEVPDGVILGFGDG